MKYGIKKMYEAAAGEPGGGAPALTAEILMKELGTIKGALEKNFEKKAADQEKNWQDKLDAANEAITELKALGETKEKDNADKLKAIQTDLDITLKAFDKLQLRLKAEARTNFGGAGEDTSLKGQIAKAFGGFREKVMKGTISKGENEATLQMKGLTDMSVVNSISTGVVPNTYRSGIVPLPFEMVHLRDIVNVTPSETDSYHFYRHTGGDGTIDWQVQELATKQQIDEDFNETTVNLDYLAGWLRISRKMLRNFSGLQAYITRWLPERYYQREDNKGWQNILANATGQTVTSSDIMTSIIRTIGAQRKARYDVNGIVVDGAVWANMLTYKAATSGEFTVPIGTVTISPTGQMMICGIPVYVASWVGGDTAVIADWKNFEIIQSEALSLQFFEQDGTNVRENKITCRIEASIGFAMLNPAAFSVLSLSSVS
jgi:HK97 family phage major capsid protein